MYTADSPLLGEPKASEAQVVSFMLARPHGEYTEKDIAGAIVPAYFRQGLFLGIDPVLAIAQMIHETGNLTSFWSQRPQRNPAGIGVNGRKQQQAPGEKERQLWQFNTQRQSWEMGLSFESWDKHAIPAHLGRLLLYALAAGEGTPAQQTMVAQTLAWRPFPPGFRGTARTLRPLGKAHNPMGPQGCGWASPGTRYGEMIAEVASAIARTPVAGMAPVR